MVWGIYIAIYTRQESVCVWAWNGIYIYTFLGVVADGGVSVSVSVGVRVSVRVRDVG